MRNCIFPILMTVGFGSAVIADETSPAEVTESPVYSITAAKPNELAMEYAFWPPIERQVDANAMPMFSRAVLMFLLQDPDENQSPIMTLYDERKESAWTDDRVSECETILSRYQKIFGELDRATDCMRIDYPMRAVDLTPGELIRLELPELQRSRMLARLLVVRGTMEIHQGRWHAFARTMQTMFRLAEMVSVSETFLIGQLVGLAIAGEAHGLLTDAWSVPGCPSFRNAMLSVPDSVFDLGDVLKLEIIASSRLFPQLSDLPDEAIGESASDARLRRWFREFSKLASGNGSPSNADQWDEFSTNGLISSLEHPAREFLQNVPRWHSRLDELSSSEIVLRASSHDLLQQVHRAIAAASLPIDLRSEKFLAFEKAFTKTSNDGRDRWPSRMVMNILMPSTAKANDAGLRGLHRHRGLIAIETLRLAATETLPEIRLPEIRLPEIRLPEILDETLRPIEPEQYERISDTEAILRRPYAVDSDREKVYRLMFVP